MLRIAVCVAVVCGVVTAHAAPPDARGQFGTPITMPVTAADLSVLGFLPDTKTTLIHHQPSELFWVDLDRCNVTKRWTIPTGRTPIAVSNDLRWIAFSHDGNTELWDLYTRGNCDRRFSRQASRASHDSSSRAIGLSFMATYTRCKNFSPAYSTRSTLAATRTQR
jgi:hypothetical protein